MKLIPSFLSVAAVISASAAGFIPEVTRVAEGPVRVDADPIPYLASSSRRAATENVTDQPLFTADVAQALAPVWSENFDSGSLKNWIVEANNVTWTVKAFSGDKSFDAIDPENLNSLQVEGPYQIYKREISSITSSEVTIPANALLSGYVGYSLNFDDVCRLIISISTDDFETSTDLWNSKDGEGDRAWAWRPAKADLAQWAGKKAKIRLTYTWGSGDETFKSGGYMGDFLVDGLKISGLAPIDNVSLSTGEKLRLVSLVSDVRAYKWTMPGAVPEESTEANPEIYYTADGNYSVSLEVTAPDGEVSSYTAMDFVAVTGTEPVAKIAPPAGFSYVDQSLEYPYMVAPLAAVTFKDVSTGFPSDRTWVFSGLTDGAPSAMVETKEQDPSVHFMYQHNWPVGLTVANEHGTSSDLVTVAAEYEGAITNCKKGDAPINYDLQDWGIFPGSNNHKITRYAERFTAPSRPAIVGGVYVYFIDAPHTVEITDNTTVTVSLYTSENGLPGKRLDFDLCDVIDLKSPSGDGSLQGTWFEFPELPKVSDEFFIVIDGLPEPHDDFKGVSFAMASWRPDGNTALLELDGKWHEVNAYFGADKCTSYYVRPVIRHSVMTSLPVDNDVVSFAAEGGEATHTIFSYMGRKEKVDCDADWCRITSIPGDMTVDELTITCDPNTTKADREAHLTLSDGVGSMMLTVKQSATSGVDIAQVTKGAVSAYPTIFDSTFTLTFPAGSSRIQVIDLNGHLIMSRWADPAATTATIDGSWWSSGVYIVLVDDKPIKVMRR